MRPMRYADRHRAGKALAERLQEYASEDPVVIALPRGGVPVAVEVARALGAPLDVLVVRKLGAPGNAELGVGAIAEDGTSVLDRDLVRRTGMTEELLEATVDREKQELRRRVALYRGSRAPASLAGRTVIVVDDGVATGLTDLAAVRAIRRAGAGKIVVAVPVGARDSLGLLAREADDVVCDLIPDELLGVGRWYVNFAPVEDDEVLELLGGRQRQDQG